MSQTQSAHVCTSSPPSLNAGWVFIHSAASDRAALQVLHRHWSNSKASAYNDALLLGCQALADQARTAEQLAIQRGLLLHIGVPEAAKDHNPDGQWRNDLVAYAAKGAKC